MKEAAAKSADYQPLPEYPRPQFMRVQEGLMEDEGLIEEKRLQMNCADPTWENLNGWWDYAFAGEERPDHWDGKILVPFSPEAPLSGVDRQLKPDEFLWYHRDFQVGGDEVSGRWLLHFGAVDQKCRVFLNGKEIGRHSGGYLPFTIEMTGALKPGENELELCVSDVSDTSYLTRGKQKIARGGMFYTAQSGIWQTVWMERVPEQYIRSVKITSERDAFQIVVQIDGSEEGTEVGAEVFAPKSPAPDGGARALCEGAPMAAGSVILAESGKVSLTAGGNTDLAESGNTGLTESGKVGLTEGRKARQNAGGKARLQIAVPEPKEWAPEAPWLYGIRIRCGEDTVYTYGAIREVSLLPAREGAVTKADEHEEGCNAACEAGAEQENAMSAAGAEQENAMSAAGAEQERVGSAAVSEAAGEVGGELCNRLCLNGKPCFMNGVLDQGYWPESLMTAPADEALIHDIMEMKRLGFNMMRVHCKIGADRFYYHCDRLGMLVWQDMVNGGWNYNMPRLCYLPTFFPRLFGQKTDKTVWDRQRTGRTNIASRTLWLREAKATVRCLRNHPSIVLWVLFNEGWGQFDSALNTEKIRALDPTRLIDSASGWFDQGAGDVASVHNYFRKLEVVPDPKRAFAITEYGGFSLLAEDHAWNTEVYGYGQLEDPAQLQARYAETMDEIRALAGKGLAAAVYTQVSDIEDECNGLLTYDREECKVDKEGNQ